MHIKYINNLLYFCDYGWMDYFCYFPLYMCGQFWCSSSKPTVSKLTNLHQVQLKWGSNRGNTIIWLEFWNFYSTDDSGIRIFYTKHLRHYDVGNVQIGQNDLEIPPMSVNVTQQGGCSDTCTSLMLPHPIYLTRTHIHMHNLGKSTLFRFQENLK